MARPKNPKINPNPQHTHARTPELPLFRAIGHRARVGDEVQFAYAGDGRELVTTTARAVFIWPGDELDLDVQIKRGGTVRYEHVRPHAGGELLPNTWWQ